jgi:hypothetical protein
VRIYGCVKRKELTVSEAGRLGGEARRESLSPDKRQQIAKAGAKARTKALTKEQRQAIAKKAAAARWVKEKTKKAT